MMKYYSIVALSLFITSAANADERAYYLLGSPSAYEQSRARSEANKLHYELVRQRKDFEQASKKAEQARRSAHIRNVQEFRKLHEYRPPCPMSGYCYHEGR